jgi:enoyl-CoA hydratase
MAELEKPIVAKVNGHAIGFGSSLVFACDLIVGAEDAVLVDMHLGMGEVPEGGPAFGIVPGDGGASLVPLFMSPVIAKEYLMLAKRYTARELADAKIINAAVAADQLDAAVDDYVTRLLKRPSYALAWTKRIINRRIVDTLNMSLDAGAAYEMVNFLQLDRMGWKDPETL